MAISFAKLHFAEPSPVARRLLWHVLSVGVASRDEPERHEGFDKPSAFLFWTASGHGCLELEGRIFSLAPGPRCWLLDLSEPRVYVPDSSGPLVTEGVRFGGLGLEFWLESFGAGAEFEFRNAGEFVLLRRAWRTLRKTIVRRPAGFEWQAHLLLTAMLGQLLKVRKLLSAPVSSTPQPVRRVLDAVLARAERDWKARELSAVAGVGYSTLRSLFKQSQQETLHEFLQRTRLDQARLLLCDPRLSVKDVARQLNISSEFYFSHFFREATGLSPSQFRVKSKT